MDCSIASIRCRNSNGANSVSTAAAQFRNQGCWPEIGFAVAQIRAQREVCSPFHGKSLRSKVPSPHKSPARYVGYLAGI
jgi:hypothetical protein